MHYHNTMVQNRKPNTNRSPRPPRFSDDPRPRRKPTQGNENELDTTVINFTSAALAFMDSSDHYPRSGPSARTINLLRQAGATVLNAAGPDVRAADLSFHPTVVRRQIPTSRPQALWRPRYSSSSFASPIPSTSTSSSSVPPSPQTVVRTVSFADIKVTDDFKASNYATPRVFSGRSANFTASTNPTGDLITSRGLVQPASTPEEAMKIIADIGNGTALHPKRFGDSTLVQKAISSSIVALTAENFTPGNTLVVFTPILKSHKGAFVCQLPGGDSANNFSWVTSGPGKTLVAAISPDRDAEELGTSLGNLYAKLTTSIPTVVGGTNVVTAQISQEMGEVGINPLLTVPGKLASIARDRTAPISIIGTEKHSVHSFTALMPDNVVRKFNSYDPLNTSLTRSSAGPQNAEMSSTIETSNNYAIYSPASTTTDPGSLGWAAPFGVRNSEVDVSGPFNGDLWRLSDHSDGIRHLLFGSFTLNLSAVTLQASTSNDSGTSAFLRMQTNYADGTFVIVTLRPILLSKKDSVHTIPLDFCFRTDGYDGAFSSKAGLPITDIMINYSTTALDGTITTNGGVSVIFHDVPAVSPYLVSLVTGAQVGAQINLELVAHTEIRPDPSTRIAQYLSSSPDLPYNARNFKAVLLGIDLTAFPMSGKEPEAGDFGKRLKTFFGNAWHAVKPAVGTFIDSYAPGGGAIVNSLPSKRRPRYRAAGFSSGQRLVTTGFSFPVVSDRGHEALAALIPIVRGQGKRPEFASLARYQISSGASDYSGSSHGLAFALATLATFGFKVRVGPFTGQVRDFAVDRDSASFTVYPVALTDIKLSAYPKLTALTPNGWSIDGSLRRPLASDFVNPAYTDLRIREMPEEDHGSPYSFTFLRI